MRLLPILVVLAGCAASTDVADEKPDPDAPPTPGTDEPAGATWSMTSPAGIQQLPERDVAVAGEIELALRGWEQIATASAIDGSAGLSIVPRRAGRRPLPLLAEPTTNRTLVWMLTPIGVFWHNPIVWDDGKVDTDGRVLYHVLEGGVLSATWTRPPEDVSFSVELSAPPTQLDAGLYRVGPLRVRVVAGTPVATGNTLDVAPAGSVLQLLVYADPLLDGAAVNAAGALTKRIPGFVFEVPGPVAEKHVRVQSATLGLDTFLALGTSTSDTPGPTLFLDRGELAVGDSGWRITALAAKIIKDGVIGMRRMRYAHTAGVGSQTFNFYVFSPRGTVTLWPVGRVTAPYRLSLFEHGAARVVHADFPATSNDYSEDLPMGRDVLQTRTAWAWDETTLVEASAMRATQRIAHTGQEGNSVDGGWRHTITGPLSQFFVGDANGFVPTTVPAAGAYRYDDGDALYAVYPAHAVFHRQRAWTGAWEDRASRVAALKLGATIYVGSIKDLHRTDSLAAGSTLAINQVIHVDDVASDPAALHERYELTAPLRDGMLDLDRGAVPTAPWDLAVTTDTRTVVFQ